MRNIIAILIFTIFIFGCNDDQIGDPMLDLPYQILVSPLNSTVDYCDIHFEWDEVRIEDDFILNISTTENFDDIVFTDTTDVQEYHFDEVLQPNKKYFWRIMSGGAVEVGEFTTQDEPTLSDFNGTFTVIKHTFNPAYFPMDTYDTLIADIQILQDGSPTLVLNSTNSIETGFFEHEYSSCSVLVFSNNGYVTGNSYAKSGSLDIENRTFSFGISETRPAAQIFTSYSGSID